MPNAKLRQDTVRSLAYLGQNNSQCIYWDETLKGFGLRVFPAAAERSSAPIEYTADAALPPWAAPTS